MEAYIHIGNESVIAPDYIVNELILKGTHQSFDSLITNEKKSDYSFTLLEATYRERTGNRFDPSDYISFGLADKNGCLTNAGKLLTDQHTVYNSRVFCTRWNGLEKGSNMYDDRVEIVSPGGMFEGPPIQECDIRSIRSVRRNPVIADLFHRMKYMERRGSGLKKIISETEKLPGYTEQLRPAFFSNAADFRVVLKNVNYTPENRVPQVKLQVNLQDNPQDNPQDNLQVTVFNQILSFCILPRSKKEITAFCGYRDTRSFTSHYIRPLLESGQLKMTLPEKPSSRNQKYVTVKAQ